ncbi:cobalt ECF transporter T component CbiQ [Clostridium malenominatum]
MLKLIMALSKRNRISNVHPIEKVFLTIVPIIIMGFVNNPIIIIINIGLFILLHGVVKNNPNIVIKFALRIAAFAAFSSITFVFDYGISYTLTIILKSIFSGLSLCFLSLTTPIDQLLYICSKNDYLRDICDIAKSMERFLMVMDEEYNIMYNAMKSRGGFDSFSAKVNSTGKIAALLFVNTMERWKSIKDGINSRCYKGYMPYLGEDFEFSRRRFLIILLYNTILILSLFGVEFL